MANKSPGISAQVLDVSPDVIAKLLAGEMDNLTKVLRGPTPIIADDSVKFGPSFMIPEGMTYEAAAAILERKREEEETETEFSREYFYRPMDGAYATIQILKEMFGITLGKTIHGFFTDHPPEMRKVDISPTESEQVPWGQMLVPTMDGVVLQTGSKMHHEFGAIYQLHARGKRKYATQITALFDAIEERLKTGSIYRGKAITGLAEPRFLDLSTFDPESVVYAAQVHDELHRSLWTILRHTDAMRRDNLPRKRAILLHGPYGVGKTLTGQLTAQIATECGWTFVAARPGHDDLEDVMHTARLYEPCVAFFEDVDNATSTDDDNEVAELLDTFDGITAKGGELVVVMTTNHIERIHKGMLRPGRLDALIEIKALDRPAIEKMIRQSIGATQLNDAIDWDLVHGAMDEFYPAFIQEAVNRATAVALSRVEGKPEYDITTSDLIAAAQSLRPQLAVMQNAQEGEAQPTLDTALMEAVSDAIHGVAVVNNDDIKMFSLNANGNGDD